MATQNIVCTVNSVGQGDMTVVPNPADVKPNTEIVWQIKKGDNLPNDVVSVAFDNIVAAPGSENVFSGQGGKQPHSSGSNWKGTIGSQQDGNSENYIIYYTITLKNGTVLQRHDPVINVGH